MKADLGWKKKDVWRKVSNTFSVEVVHWTVAWTGSGSFGPERWNVYACIWETHPRFELIKSLHMWDDAVEQLPLHWGCSFVERAETSCSKYVRVGSDYLHVDDTKYSKTTRKKQPAARKVFADAQELFDFLLQEETSKQCNKEPLDDTTTVS